MSYRLRWGLIPLALIPLALLRATLLAESDTFWQIRTGLDILRTHAIPDRDPYSWTAIGAEWHPNSWAFDVLLAIAYRVDDLPLVALAAAAFIPFIGWVVALSARRLGARPGVAAWVVVLGLILVVGWLSARPQLVDYAFAPAILLLLDVAVARRTTLRSMPALIGIGVAEAAWVNLHTAAPLGLGLIGCAGLGYALRDRNPSSVPTTAAALLSALLGCLASPLGWQLFGHVLAVRDASADIVEWGHVSLAEPTSLFYLALAVAATVAAGRMGSHPLMIAIGALTVAGAFTIRFLPIACVLGLPVFAASLSTWRPAVTYFSRRRSFLTFGLLALLSAQTALALARIDHIGRPQYPMRAVQAIPSGCRLFNSYLLGGPVILRRPEILVSQDSRNDVYGADALDVAHSIEFGRDGRSDLDSAGVTCVMVPPDSPLARHLVADPGWRLVVSQGTGALYVRR